jgi:hypothetical protein
MMKLSTFRILDLELEQEDHKIQNIFLFFAVSHFIIRHVKELFINRVS